MNIKLAIPFTFIFCLIGAYVLNSGLAAGITYMLDGGQWLRNGDVLAWMYLSGIFLINALAIFLSYRGTTNSKSISREQFVGFRFVFWFMIGLTIIEIALLIYNYDS